MRILWIYSCIKRREIRMRHPLFTPPQKKKRMGRKPVRN